MADPRGLEFITAQTGSDGGSAIGPRVNADLFIMDQVHGLVMRDRNTGSYFRLFFADGQLQYEEVALTPPQ